MKQEIWINREGYLTVARPAAILEPKFLGTIDIEPVKKVVTKEVGGYREPSQLSWIVMAVNKYGNPVAVPDNAKNIRIVYDIEE